MFIERYDGSALMIEVDEKIYDVKSLQRIQIFKTKSFGKMLVLDGKIQFTERDEFFYHEMLVHPAMLLHENPDEVLIIGGGDGGALREVLKHNPKRVTLVEIDRNVIDACKRYIGIDRGSLDDDRVEIVYGNGFEFVMNTDRNFDVIIVDGTDPNTISSPLISKRFYEKCSRMCDYFVTQAQSPFIQVEYFKSILRNAVFRNKAVYLGYVPTYPHGLWSYLIGSNRRELTVDLNTLNERYEKRGLETRYYTPELHVSSFVLPKWIRDIVNSVLRE